MRLHGTPAELLIEFVTYVSTQSVRSKSCNALINILWRHLEHKILANNDIHVYAAAKTASSTCRQRLISKFYEAQEAIGINRRSCNTALLRAQRAGTANIYGVFGGQGNTREYFEELRTLRNTYPNLLAGLIQTCSSHLSSLAAKPSIADQFPQGLNVSRWLEDAKHTPDVEYLIRAPVSFPLIGLLQLCYVRALVASLGGNPAEFTTAFSGFAGHSQGAVVAAAMATVTTWESFEHVALTATTVLLHIGARSQQSFRQTPLAPEKEVVLDAAGLGTPSPMLSITGIGHADLVTVVDATNAHLAVDVQMAVSLANRDDTFVVSGPERTLAALVEALGGGRPTEPQERVPSSQRKMTPRLRFLPISIPCHSPMLAGATPLILRDLQAAGVRLDSAALRVPVNQGVDGGHLAEGCKDDNLIPYLVEGITTRAVDWRTAAFPSATHIIDFGPGGPSGVGALIMEKLSGTGARVIVAGRNGLHIPEQQDMGSLVEMYDRRDEGLKWNVDWHKDFGPSLVRTAGKLALDSRMSRLLGLPPVMVAGMTPTTTHPEFVSSVMRAGYHVEFACGGYNTPAALRAAILEMVTMLPAGRGLTLNVIYANPKALAWQIPLIRRLRNVEQVPIVGLTVGGGIPSLQVAAEYITTLGISHLSLKPGSATAIQQVLAIARAHPNFPIMLQWTGGRSGGHHSFEDFHAPILEAYPRIRQYGNVILIAGSGFSEAEDIYPYLTGTWSLSHGRGRASRMPFDGVLLGSRVMACAEALTSAAAKQAIVDCSGLSDHEWEGTYGPQGAGGVVSITSEMGEPMHVVATRGALLWAELDRVLFSIPKGPRRGAKLEEMRNHELITRLNRDFQKPWFACRSTVSGAQVACELLDMTYAEVAWRVVKLCSVNGKTWIDETYAELLGGFLMRAQQRFLDAVALEGCDATALQERCRLDPSASVSSVMADIPEALDTQLYLEDVHFFEQLCATPGMKPVPFIPALDSKFETWFKKDSLWQSENLQAVVDGDAGRVLILHGPVATRGVKVVDEPVGQVLDGIMNGVLGRLLSDRYQDDADAVPTAEYIPGLSFQNLISVNEAMESDDWELAAEGNEDDPIGTDIMRGSLNGESLRAAICTNDSDQRESWRHALFHSRHIFRGTRLVENPMWTITEALWAERVEILTANDSTTITILGVKENTHTQESTLLQIMKPTTSTSIEIRLFTFRTPSAPVPLLLQLTYHPATPYSLIREPPNLRNQALYNVYRELWLTSNVTFESGWFTETVNITASRVSKFNQAVGYSKAHQSETVSMDFAMVVSWGTICSALLADPVKGDLLRLVHLSNSFEFATDDDDHRGDESMGIGHVITARACVSRVMPARGSDGAVTGCEIDVLCHLNSSNGTLIMTIRSRFLIRGQPDDDAVTEGITYFSHTENAPVEIVLKSVADVALFWVNIQDYLVAPNAETGANSTLENLMATYLTDVAVRPQTVEFHTETHITDNNIKTSGNLQLRTDSGLVQMANISRTSLGKCPLQAYLATYGRQLNQPILLLQPIHYPPIVAAIKVPCTNLPYSLASGDMNPIHTSRIFAALAGNADTITHGMYVSATVRQVLERAVAAQRPERILRYEARFVNMVLPGDVLDVTFTHAAMLNGCLVFDISVSRQARAGTDDDGQSTVVMQGSATLTQPPTVILFTGQGSQEVNMGMDLYETSSVARAVWDEADTYLRENLGLSLLYIVRQNPKSIKVTFGGRRGAALRQKYMAATTEGRPMFPGVTATTSSYTHWAPGGLLFTTQFSQLAITVMEVAAMRDMRAAGVVDVSRSRFAGHSLGEYGALAAVTDCLPLSSLLPMIMARGATMQKAVERDADGRSAFAMVAVDPGRVVLGGTRGTLSPTLLEALVVQIAKRMGLLLEIVNFNVRNAQYVCAGELRALHVLQQVLDDAATRETIPEQLCSLVERHVAELDLCATDGIKTSIRLVRGRATIPLVGIDVPFHSSHIAPRRSAFQESLLVAIKPERVRASQLVGKYVPNVTGRPFEISRDYFEQVAALTGSKRIKAVLTDWDAWTARKQGLQRLAAV
ncbi:hypothetical protein MCOR25_009120 [Pyricularia grisea]|nr:hypothetical protein MCOR25_009120 [Pyricularia grisea]